MTAVAVPITSGSVIVSGEVGISGTVGILSGAWINALVSGTVTTTVSIPITSGSVIVSGNVSVSGTVSLISGAWLASGIYVKADMFSGGPMIVTSGLVLAKSSGEWYETHIISGSVNLGIQSAVYNGNASGNPCILSDLSGGVILYSTACVAVTIKALARNSGEVLIGGATAGHMPFSGFGFTLAPGEGVNMTIDNVGRIRATSTVSGWNWVNWIASV